MMNYYYRPISLTDQKLIVANLQLVIPDVKSISDIRELEDSSIANQGIFVVINTEEILNKMRKGGVLKKINRDGAVYIFFFSGDIKTFIAKTEWNNFLEKGFCHSFDRKDIDMLASDNFESKLRKETGNGFKTKIKNAYSFEGLIIWLTVFVIYGLYCYSQYRAHRPTSIKWFVISIIMGPGFILGKGTYENCKKLFNIVCKLKETIVKLCK